MNLSEFIDILGELSVSACSENKCFHIYKIYRFLVRIYARAEIFNDPSRPQVCITASPSEAGNFMDAFSANSHKLVEILDLKAARIRLLLCETRHRRFAMLLYDE